VWVTTSGVISNTSNYADVFESYFVFNDSNVPVMSSIQASNPPLTIQANAETMFSFNRRFTTSNTFQIDTIELLGYASTAISTFDIKGVQMFMLGNLN
jgi:SOS-response transcriptional repressor LexA